MPRAVGVLVADPTPPPPPPFHYLPPTAFKPTPLHLYAPPPPSLFFLLYRRVWGAWFILEPQKGAAQAQAEAGRPKALISPKLIINTPKLPLPSSHASSRFQVRAE